MAPLQHGDRMSTLTREQIKKQNNPRAVTWVSPHHGDGGWHTTPGCQEFVTEWEPLRDRIMVRLFPEKVKYENIIRPESAAPVQVHSRRGIILKVGPGRWRDGEFYPTEVKPGMEVTIGPHHDWSSLDAGWGAEIVIAMEGDIRVIHGKTDGSSA